LEEFDCDYTDEWDRYADYRGLNKHLRAWQGAPREDWRKYPGVDVADLSELVDRIFNSPPISLEIITAIWAMWFYRATKVSKEAQHELRKLPYKDYISSDYWRRGRAAE